MFVLAWGLARAEGDASLWDGSEEQTPETHYQLSGIVVHSGQASGGHYYSYVLLRYFISKSALKKLLCSVFFSFNENF